MSELTGNERIDDLGRGGRYIIQNTDEFCFGVDAVLLAHFPAWHSGDSVLDLGTGTGVIPLLIADEVRHIEAVELNPALAELARRNVALNDLTDKITVRQGDLRQPADIYAASSFDRVIVNPPYYPAGRGKINPRAGLAMARHEITATLADVIRAARWALRYGGKLSMVHIPSRLQEIVAELTSHRFRLQRLRFVQPTATKAANLLLLEASVGMGHSTVEILPPLIMREPDGTYTAELQKIYTK